LAPACLAMVLSGGVLANDTALILEEVVVTAQRREQSLNDVPISIVAMNKDMLESRRIETIVDLQGTVPNLFVQPFNNDPTAVRLFIRGIGQNNIHGVN
jgi:iron complex outermembrane receptor protein